MNELSPITRGLWMTLPAKILHTCNGRSRLLVSEYDKTKVQKPRRRVRPLVQSSKDLSFGAWRLAHALKKTDCAQWPSSQILFGWEPLIFFLRTFICSIGTRGIYV